MNPSRTKEGQRRLDGHKYNELRLQVLRRDGWRCQCCGKMSNLELHHKQFRSRLGGDSEQNLITLCAACHASVHSQVKNLSLLMVKLY
jgi:5-methylcytosine-specific restriction endonuclease McrA